MCRPRCSASRPVWTRRRVPSFCAENCGKSAVAVHQQGRLPPLRGARLIPMVLTVHADIEIPLLPYTRWSMSLLLWMCSSPCFWQPLLRFLVFACGVQDYGFSGSYQECRIHLSLVRQWIRVRRQSTKPFGNLWTLVFLRNAWFDSGFMLMRQTIEALVWHVQGWFSLSVDISVVVQRPWSCSVPWKFSSCSTLTR